MENKERNIDGLYEMWTSDVYFADTWEELNTAGENSADVRDRFYKELDFGTAGIRGIMGAGTNRMNAYVVRRLSYAIAKHIVSKGEDAMKRGIVIGYDSRNNSELYAKEAAAIYAGFGIRTYIHGEICPVPLLSFSVRHLKTEAGVMITASHNPKEYNGYKVYGADGAQLSLEDSAGVSKIVASIEDYRSVPKFNYNFLLGIKKISIVKRSVREAYLQTIMKLAQEAPIESDLKIVYTPLHGAGAKFVPEALSRLGLTQVTLVEEQMAPNGDFPTVKVPNPEDPGAYHIALELAKNIGADLILATDPDSDRTGAYALNEQGEYEMLNGNQLGILLLAKRASGKMPEKPFAVSTIVSTRLSEKICKAYGVEYVDVLTGFKFIGEQIMLREEQGDQNFIFGFEESYGYLAGSYARDKDAVASCMLLAETAAFYKKQGKTLFQALNEIYAQFGAQAETQISLTLSGEAGLAKMAKLMADLRSCNGKVLDICPSVYKDYKSSVEIHFDETGNVTEEGIISLPKSDVLYYTYPDFWFCLRPSGTEPKVKVYFGAGGEDRMKAQENVLKVRDMVKTKLNTFLD